MSIDLNPGECVTRINLWEGVKDGKLRVFGIPADSPARPDFDASHPQIFNNGRVSVGPKSTPSTFLTVSKNLLSASFKEFVICSLKARETTIKAVDVGPHTVIIDATVTMHP